MSVVLVDNGDDTDIELYATNKTNIEFGWVKSWQKYPESVADNLYGGTDIAPSTYQQNLRRIIASLSTISGDTSVNQQRILTHTVLIDYLINTAFLCLSPEKRSAVSNRIDSTLQSSTIYVFGDSLRKDWSVNEDIRTVLWKNVITFFMQDINVCQSKRSKWHMWLLIGEIKKMFKIFNTQYSTGVSVRVKDNIRKCNQLIAIVRTIFYDSGGGGSVGMVWEGTYKHGWTLIDRGGGSGGGGSGGSSASSASSTSSASSGGGASSGKRKRNEVYFRF